MVNSVTYALLVFSSNNNSKPLIKILSPSPFPTFSIGHSINVQDTRLGLDIESLVNSSGEYCLITYIEHQVIMGGFGDLTNTTKLVLENKSEDFS